MTELLLERARRLGTYGPFSSANTVSDRPLVIDSPIVPTDKHWLVPLLSGQFLQSYGAGALPMAGFYLCDSKIVPPLALFTPPSRILGDTVATFDTADRMLPIRETLNEVVVSPNGTHAKGIIVAGNGLADPIEVIEGWYIRMILDGLGLAAGGSTPPFPPADAVMTMIFQYVEEATRAGATTPTDPYCNT